MQQPTPGLGAEPSQIHFTASMRFRFENTEHTSHVQSTHPRLDAAVSAAARHLRALSVELVDVIEVRITSTISAGEGAAGTDSTLFDVEAGADDAITALERYGHQLSGPAEPRPTRAVWAAAARTLSPPPATTASTQGVQR